MYVKARILMRRLNCFLKNADCSPAGDCIGETPSGHISYLLHESLSTHLAYSIHRLYICREHAGIMY